MNELHRNDDTPAYEPLSTADIAHPETARQTRAGIERDPRDPGDPLNRRDEAARADRNDGPILLPASSPTASPAARASGPLFPEDELHNFRARWDSVQTSFVDEPREAVERADSLVANVVKRIAEQFSDERTRLEDQWAKGDNVSTEDLRQALKRYHSFFDRLLSF